MKHESHVSLMGVVGRLLLPLALAALACAPLEGLLSSDEPTSAPTEADEGCVLPSVVGMTEAAAREALSALGLNALVVSQRSDTVEAGLVISLAPPAGTRINPCAGDVTLVVSSGAARGKAATPAPPAEPTVTPAPVATSSGGGSSSEGGGEYPDQDDIPLFQNVYYIERFEDRQSNPLPDWSVDAGAGSLRVSNGYLVVDGYAAAFLGDETWYNARIAFGDGVYEEVNEFHVMMHMQDERNYMGMSCSRSSGFLVCGGVEVVNGAESPVNGFGQGTRLCAEGQMECTIAFQVIDGRYSVAVNGQEVVAFTDSTFESGAVGFAVDGAYSVNYILVYEPPYGASTGYTLFRDDFDTDGWSAEVDDDDYAVVTKSVEGGVYRWEVEAKQGVVASEIREVLQTAETDGYPNRFAYSARTRQVSGPADAAHGLLFRARDYDNFYYFRVTNEGEAGLYALVENEWNELVTPVYTEAYKPGEVNELRVVTEAGRFSFWINGVYLFQANDSRFPLGSIGMAVELVEAGQVGEFEFDDVRIAVRAR